MMELLLPFHGDAWSAPLLLALGAVTGVLSAFFGIGGGWVVTPALNMLGLGASNAVGTGMAFLAGTGARGM